MLLVVLKIHAQAGGYLPFYIDTSKILIHDLKHIPPLKTWRNLEKMNLTEPGRQKLGRYRSPVSRHSIQSYILTCYRFRKREPLIALGSHQKGL